MAARRRWPQGPFNDSLQVWITLHGHDESIRNTRDRDKSESFARSGCHSTSAHRRDILASMGHSSGQITPFLVCDFVEKFIVVALHSDAYRLAHCLALQFQSCILDN